MPRPLLALALLLALPACASAAGVPFDDPAHPHFFRYQAYLLKKDLKGHDKASWAKLKTAEQEELLKKGEAFLKRRFEELMTDSSISHDEHELLEAVWGKDIADAARRLGAARALKDEDQLKRASEDMSALAKKLGAKDLDWKSVFDGVAPGSPAAADPARTDYLAVTKPKGFLDSLRDPQVLAPLKTQETFAKFLRDNLVPGDALPGLLAMYSVLDKAPPAEKKALSHILPTVVRFLKDGKSVSIEGGDALGYAVPGDYDRPEKVILTRKVKDADPLVVGKTLAHEFQHIYDMYSGRYYTLDSELRGFKVAVLYFKALKAAAPKKHAELLNSDDDGTRRIVRDVVSYTEAYDKGPKPFSEAVAFGHGYNAWSQGVFMGRMPLKEAVDPVLGAPRELAALHSLRDKEKTRVAELERRQAALRAKLKAGASRELDKELEKATKDLEASRDLHNALDRKAVLMELRISRMRSERAWHEKRAKARGLKDPPPYDLELSVDKDYLTP